MPFPDPVPSDPCPCGTGAAAAACCGRWHAGPQHLQAPDAPTLMRSRYCAYVLGLSDYLMATWHPHTRPLSLELDPKLHWLGLEVRRHASQDEHHATVEFVARSKLGSRASRLHECSRFERIDRHWFYLDGEIFRSLVVRPISNERPSGPTARPWR